MWNVVRIFRLDTCHSVVGCVERDLRPVVRKDQLRRIGQRGLHLRPPVVRPQHAEDGLRVFLRIVKVGRECLPPARHSRGLQKPAIPVVHEDHGQAAVDGVARELLDDGDNASEERCPCLGVK